MVHELSVARADGVAAVGDAERDARVETDAIREASADGDGFVADAAALDDALPHMVTVRVMGVSEGDCVTRTCDGEPDELRVNASVVVRVPVAPPDADVDSVAVTDAELDTLADPDGDELVEPQPELDRVGALLIERDTVTRGEDEGESVADAHEVALAERDARVVDAVADGGAAVALAPGDSEY